MQTVNGKNILISKDGEEVQEIVRAYGRIIWLASGVAGQSATIDSVLAVTLPAGAEATAENIGTNQNARFVFGIPEGNGIASIEKTGSTDNVDHYRIHYTNGGYFDYDVTNGGGGSGSSVWGQITGTLSNQTDLQEALNAKADSADLGAMAGEDDAPSDDKTYGRKNGEWSEVTGGGGSSVWGQITGTLSDQTDLQEALDNKADVIVNSASGATVSIPDAKASPVVGLSVGIEPVQDLHGQSSPYPAGGGKNKFDKDNITALDDCYMNNMTVANGGGNRGLILPCLPNQTYTLSVVNKNTVDLNICSFEEIPTLGSIATAKGTSTSAATDKKATVTTGASDAYLFVKYNNTNQTQTYTNQQILDGLMIELGSTATTYAPYSNVCPISGHTSATAERTGKNLLNHATSTEGYRTDNVGGITVAANYSVSDYMMCRYNEELYLDHVIGSQSGYTIWMYDIDKNPLNYINIYGSSDVSGKKTINEQNARWMRISYPTAQKDAVQVSIGSTTTAYEPYQGQQVTIALGQTVYGGTVDFKAGTMTVDRKYDLIDSTKIASSVDIYTYAISDMMSGNKLAGICDTFPTSSASSDFGIRFGANNSTAYFYKLNDNVPGISNLTTCKAWFAEHPVHIVYPLATPIVITGLTPATLSLLYGTNTVWADTGDVSVDYKADTKLYIEALKAQLHALILQN